MGLPLRVSVLQKADRVVFVPVCFLLTRLRKLLPELPADQPPKPKRIVIVKLAEQGSTVLANNAIRRAVEMVGRENVYFAAFEENRFIVDVLDLIPRGNVLTVPTTSVVAMLFGTLRMLLRMRLLRIDAAVDLEFLARFSAAIAYLSGARIRVGMHCYFEEGPYRGDLMTHRVLFNPQLHTSEMFQVMIEALAFAPKDFPAFNLKLKTVAAEEPVFSPRPEEIKGVEQMVLSLTGGAQDPSADSLESKRERFSSSATVAVGILPRVGQGTVGTVPGSSHRLHRPGLRGWAERRARQGDRQRALLFHGREDHPAPTPCALHPRPRAGDQRQRPGAFRDAHADPGRVPFWSGKSEAFCRTFPTDACGLCGHRLQSLHQRAQ